MSTLQKNMRHYVSSQDAIISSSPKDIGGLTLDEVEIPAQIDGKGNVENFGNRWDVVCYTRCNQICVAKDVAKVLWPKCAPGI